MHPIITISGTPGSGKSTIAQKLSEKLNAERIYVGAIRRELAREKGMTLEQLNEYGLTHPETDVDIDQKIAMQARQVAKKGPVIVEGRTQFHFIPESFKIFIKVTVEEGARRIWKQVQNAKEKKLRNEGEINSIIDLAADIKKRVENDKKRYKKYYNLDHTDESHYDLVIDTTDISAEQAASLILKTLPKLD
ncbi:MAG: AAA family ATPase [Candidatus Parcubacteria bacterium]|nr:AAA family ATPase [Candidatus Parcubacteria bacterium]